MRTNGVAVAAWVQRCSRILVSPSLGGETAAAIPDPYDGVVAAFQHLLGLGHTHVLYLAGLDGAEIGQPISMERRKPRRRLSLPSRAGA